ncbi:MAG: alkaline phosphatase [Xanthomonadales bacterium]|nr:alkaline phosphatase [Xanthomonadales bacterium]
MNPVSPHPVPKVIGACLGLLIMACSTTVEQRKEPSDSQVQTETPVAPAAKNVILFVGDGMGVSTVTAIRILDGQQKGLPGEENVLSFERFPHVALSKTYEIDQQVGESAGTATAIMTGLKTNAGLVGISSDAIRKNCASSREQHLPSALELAESKGMSTGVVTTTKLTHATPAATYAHVPERDWENDRDLTDEARRNGCTDIAAQLIEFPYGDGIEVALGGGRIKFLPSDIDDPEGANTDDGRQDQRNLPQEWVDKYPNSAYIWNQQQFDSIDPASTDHLLGLFQSEHMQYEADRAEDTAGEPSLAQMTRLAIEILSRNSKGYFLLVEGGRIDHGHHDNNAYRALTDGIAFADAVAIADEMTDLNDTLIIVTADHSHTFNFSGYPTRGNPILGKVDSGDSAGNPTLMGDEKPFTTLGYYVGPGADWVGGQRPDLSEVDTVNDKNYIQQAAIPAEDDAHGGEDVAVYARGPGAEYIHGVMEQNEIFHAMDKALNLTEKAVQ